jgi:hypothetical protein
MPSFFHLTIGFGGTVLVVGIMALWLHEPQPSSSLSAASLSSPRPRIVGNSALSHGGRPPKSSMAVSAPLAQFKIGQKLIVAAADNVSPTIILLPLPPASTTLFSSIVGERRIVSPGTEVFVSGMQSIEPAPGHTEQYYEVTIPHGGKGWLSERVLRPATNGD